MKPRGGVDSPQVRAAAGFTVVLTANPSQVPRRGGDQSPNHRHGPQRAGAPGRRQEGRVGGWGWSWGSDGPPSRGLAWALPHLGLFPHSKVGPPPPTRTGRAAGVKGRAGTVSETRRVLSTWSRKGPIVTWACGSSEDARILMNVPPATARGPLQT